MSITEKENILRFYRHEKPDHMPVMKYLHTLHPARGFLERPVDAEGMKYDWFGVEYVYEPKAGASLPNPNKAPIITDITKWREQVVFPDLDAVDWEEAIAKDNVAGIDRENKVLSVLVQCGIYERMHALMGMEGAMCALVEEPEAAQELIDAIAEHKYKLISYILKYYKPDILRHHDDWGSNTSMQMSPATWRKMFKPHVKRLADLCHAHGVFYEQHSCGVIESIVPEFVEIGIDSWQGTMINDVRKLQKITNKKLLYHMSLDALRYYGLDFSGQLTEELLREDVRKTVLSCAEDGTFFPVLAIKDPNWWGTSIIYDEIDRCREIAVFSDWD